MWIDGSALRLDEVLPLIERDAMSDEEIVAYLARCQLDPAAPRASVEALLHAFVPAPYVHHTDPEGIDVLAAAAHGEALVRECFGEEAAWIPDVRPGVALARQVAAAVRRDAKLLVLAGHGLVVWGDTEEEAHRRTTEASDRAVAFVAERTNGRPRFGGRRIEPDGALHDVLPAIRGVLSGVLVADTSEPVMDFVCSEDGPRLAGPLWISRPDQIGARDAGIVLVEGMGLVAAGPTPTAAKLARDRYRRTIEVMAALDERVAPESFEPVEAPPGELQGKVALITGAAGGIGRAIVDMLGAAGACIVGFDLDGDGAADAVSALGDRGLAVAGDVTSEQAVADAFAAAVDAFGGIDILVSNAGIASSASIEETTLAEWNRNHSILATGYFLVAREAFRVLKAQGRGGSVVFVASKNALVAGKNAAAYSSAKAAELHLARCLAEEGGAHGIRVNTVNPDAVLQGSKIWDSSWRQERAAAYNLDPGELDEHYRKRTTLGVSILPEDIAQAVMHFASDARSGKSTGNLLNVDGGVPAAYTR